MFWIFRRAGIGIQWSCWNKRLWWFHLSIDASVHTVVYISIVKRLMAYDASISKVQFKMGTQPRWIGNIFHDYELTVLNCLFLSFFLFFFLILFFCFSIFLFSFFFFQSILSVYFYWHLRQVTIYCWKKKWNNT